MLRLCLPFIAGAVAISLLPALPPAPLRPAVAAAALCLCLPQATRPVAAGLAGALLYWAAAAAALADRLPPEQSGNEFSFSAYIIDFPREEPGRTTLVVAPGEPALPARVRLSWYDPGARPGPGETWRVRARLKRPRGGLNPGGFDYEGWLHRERIGATGYVLDAERLAAPAVLRRPALRAAAAARIESLLPGGEATAALLAITLGARHRIAADTWQRYAATGTAHLMAISGLHVGLVAAGAGLLAWGLAGACGVRRNLRDLAVVAALPAAGSYALLSGLAVPAQRALLMAAAAALVLVARRPRRPLPVLALVAVVVLVADPLALLAPGFRLSFAAVAVLLWQARRMRCQSRPGTRPLVAGLQQLGMLQCGLLLGLFPLTAALFDRVAWLAPLTNLLVLPLFSFVTVPAALAGLLLGGPLAAAGDLLLWLAWVSLAAVHLVIDALAALPGAVRPLAAPTGAARALYLLPLAWVLLPPAFPGRSLGWLAMLAACLYRPSPPPSGCFDLATLDVGQGLAQVVVTRRHAVLFDTGPAWRGGDSAERVVLPYLATRGICRLDRVVVSHADIDHAGGIGRIVAALPVGEILGGEALDAVAGARRCRAGTGWRRDGIDFRLLHPAGSALEGNDASCVLEVAAGRHRALLTGDIGRRVEAMLVAAGLRRADVVTVPHHGSRTSSSAAFVAALAPRYAVVAAGHGNRWGFPKADVVARWQAHGAELLDTASSGALTLRICADGGVRAVHRHRQRARRYWHDAGE